MTSIKSHLPLIKQKVHQLESTLIEWYRHLHTHPELSFKEHNTKRYIQQKLTELGINSYFSLTETSVIVELEGKTGRGVVGLRADMDALPIQENTGLPHASIHQNVMHACGHDLHMACLLGALAVLQELRDLWSGKVVGIFQPGEEKAPGGGRLLLEAGLIERTGIQAVVAQHADPELPPGTIALRTGTFMASSDEIYITVKGTEGHAAYPHTTVNPVLAAAHLITTIYSKAREWHHPTEPALLNFTMIEGGKAPNVVPGSVRIGGTLRTLHPNTRATVKSKLTKLTETLARALGASTTVEIVEGYPPMINHPTLTEWVHQTAKECLGEQQVQEAQVRMGSEDFAFYAERLPACMWRLGARPDTHPPAPLHSSNLILNEKALTTGTLMLVCSAIHILEKLESSPLKG